MSLASVKLEDRYELDSGRVLLSGSQALLRVMLDQRNRDLGAGLNTAGFVSGYRGSPLGGFDHQLWRSDEQLKRAHVHFQSGVNEDLAATAVWGTQQAPLMPGCRYDGIFSMWYGKGPGVDRSGDPFKHGNLMGAATHGGVLLAAGDDHQGKSSTLAFQSEQALSANSIPVLYPANIQEYLDFGAHGFALSRYSGCWIGFKCVNETIESTSSVEVAPDRVSIVRPKGFLMSEGGLNARIGLDITGDDIRMNRFKLPAARAYAYANNLDGITLGASRGTLGIVTSGKTWADVNEALSRLGIDDHQARNLGLSVYKVGMIWPLEPNRLREFARGFDELLFIEEKKSFVEAQAASILYNLPAGERPRLIGKTDENDRVLLPSDVALEPLDIALLIGTRLKSLGVNDENLNAAAVRLKNQQDVAAAMTPASLNRTPYFCSGCPHNNSTKVPEESIAMAGIGCHTMAIFMDRNTMPPTHMGGEGLNWTGISPFSDIPHVFQNLGDGTYFHSGLMAIRGAVNAGVNITYKILYNDAVAMTGGQPVEGQLTVGDICRQVAAEGVKRVVIVSADPEKYDSSSKIPGDVKVWHRDRLMEVQRTLREEQGVTALIYDQTCAAELRRRRKRNTAPEPDRRVIINERVCEGCGDCSVEANCVSIQPLETTLGRKRQIDQSSCNKDFSCTRGFCPSFVSVVGGTLRVASRSDSTESLPVDDIALPEPVPHVLESDYSVMITGIGGTGVVTVGAVLAMAGHLENKACTTFDMTGLAQKGGAVLSHLRFAPTQSQLNTSPVSTAGCDLVLGCDAVVAAGQAVTKTIDREKTVAVINSHLAPTAMFQLNKDITFDQNEVLGGLASALSNDKLMTVNATAAAQRLLGNTIGANMFLVGFALQKGLLPVSLAAVEKAIELNGVAVEFNKTALSLGRCEAFEPGSVVTEPATIDAGAEPEPTDREVYLSGLLTAYQGKSLARRFMKRIEQVRAVESRRMPGVDSLTRAVAENYYKLLAYKDEYEVARLYADGEFKRKLSEMFSGNYSLKFHMAPPLLARPDPITGRARKIELGGWIVPLFGLIRHLRFLRGTRLDPFGYTAERRMERQLITNYETVIDELTEGLSVENQEWAVAIASLPQKIRGFGIVKQRNVESANTEQTELFGHFRSTLSGAGTGNNTQAKG
jgi:indolepyruvate ferredoxin oxidoreductase